MPAEFSQRWDRAPGNASLSHGVVTVPPKSEASFFLQTQDESLLVEGDVRKTWDKTLRVDQKDEVKAEIVYVGCVVL